MWKCCCNTKMNWEGYNGNVSIVPGEGFWAAVDYFLLPQLQYPTKGLIGVDGRKVVSLGHVWFTDPKSAQAHTYFFDKSAALYLERHNNTALFGPIIISGHITIRKNISDRLVGLAMDFRGKHPEYQDSLDLCVRTVLQRTQ